MDVLIVDDEPLARERLVRLVGQLDGYRVFEPSTSNGEEVPTPIDSLKLDIVLLNTRMSGLGGLRVVARLCKREASPAMVLCTAHDEFALKAPQINAVGYLVKSVRSEDPAEVLKKALRPNRVQLAALTKPPVSGGSGPRSHISAWTCKGIELIPLEEIASFTVDHKYVALRHAQDEMLPDEPLKALEDEFDERLVRIHRNALVARERVKRLRCTPLRYFQLCPKGLDNDALTVSRRYVVGVRRLMHQL